MTTDSKRTTFLTVDFTRLSDLYKAIGDHFSEREMLDVFVRDANGNTLDQIRFVETTLTDGSTVVDVDLVSTPTRLTPAQMQFRHESAPVTKPSPDAPTSNDGECRDCGQSGNIGFAQYMDGDEPTHWYCQYCGSNHVTVRDAAGNVIEQGDLY